MKGKALRGLRVVLSLIAFAASGGQQDGLNLVVQQIRTVGPRQWLGLMAGSIVTSAPAIALVPQRIGSSVPRSDGSAADREP